MASNHKELILNPNQIPGEMLLRLGDEMRTVLRVNGTMRGNRHLVLIQGVGDGMRAVFEEVLRM